MHYQDKKTQEILKNLDPTKTSTQMTSSMMICFPDLTYLISSKICSSLVTTPQYPTHLMACNFIRARNLTPGLVYGLLMITVQVPITKRNVFSLLWSSQGPTNQRILILSCFKVFIMFLHYSERTMGQVFVCGMDSKRKQSTHM